jgi:hypothetical protein
MVLVPPRGEVGLWDRLDLGDGDRLRGLGERRWRESLDMDVWARDPGLRRGLVKPGVVAGVREAPDFLVCSRMD